MNTRAKVLNPIIDVVDTGVDLIKGKKKQTLEPVDYSLTSIDELTAPVTKKVDEQDLRNYLISQGQKPDDVDFFMHTQFYPSEDMFNIKPNIQAVKENVNLDLDMKNIDIVDNKRVTTADTMLKSDINVNISEAAKLRDRSSSQITNAINAHNNIYKPVLDLIQENPGMSLADAVRQINPGKKDNTISNIINRNFDRNVDNLKNLLPNDQFKNYENVLNQFKKERDIYKAESSTMPKSLERELTTYKSGEGIKQRDKYKSWFGEGVLQGEHTMMRPDKYKLVELDKKDVAVKFREPEYATTKTRNETIKNEIARAIKRHLAKRNDIIKEIQEAVKTKQSNSLPTLKNELQKIDDLITDQYGKAEKLGLELAIVNQNSGKINYYGKKYNNMTELYKSFKELDYNDGGLVRPNMALGGDMAQFTEMESVVPDLNPDEAEMQLAMSFKNPFKLKKQPPLIDDVDTNLKITDQGPGTTKTATKTHTLDAGVGSDSIFYLKSDMELANAAQNKMTAQQWLGYLTKKGVSPTELDEFGLKNLLYNMGGWDEGTKKWTNNKAISKSDLIAAYKNEKPVISYKIHQIEPFEKGVSDFVSFLTKRKSGGSYYHGEKGMDEIRGLLNKPQDIAGDTLRLKLSEVLSKAGDIKKDWPMYEKGMMTDINKIFKQFYGIDDVIKNGIPEGMKIPFYSRNILERFNRLRKGEGFYFAKGKGVQHEGTQFMPGGTGYIEIPFTYNPNPKGKRANEPKFTFGEGHFTNPEGNNPVFWMRASERTDEQGNRILFIEEIQSDMHQKVKQRPNTFSYAKRQDSPGMIDSNMALKQFDNLKIELGKVTDQIDKITGHTDPSAATIMERLKVKREAIRSQMEELQNSILNAQTSKNENVFPEGPFKKSENQSKIALKTAINLAQKEGFDGVAMVTGKAKNKFANASGEVAKGNIGFYDQIAVKAMKNTAKNLDLDFSATNIKDGHGNTWAKIPVINLKETTINKSVDMYKAEGGYIHRPSFVDVVPTL
jgi:hypothetical protein